MSVIKSRSGGLLKYSKHPYSWKGEVTGAS